MPKPKTINELPISSACRYLGSIFKNPHCKEAESVEEAIEALTRSEADLPRGLDLDCVATQTRLPLLRSIWGVNKKSSNLIGLALDIVDDEGIGYALLYDCDAAGADSMYLCMFYVSDMNNWEELPGAVSDTLKQWMSLGNVSVISAGTEFGSDGQHLQIAALRVKTVCKTYAP